MVGYSSTAIMTKILKVMFVTKSVLEPRANPRNKLKIFMCCGRYYFYLQEGKFLCRISPPPPYSPPRSSAVFSLVLKNSTKKSHQSNTLIANRIFKSFQSENTQTVFGEGIFILDWILFPIRGHVEGKVNGLPTRGCRHLPYTLTPSINI